MNNKAKYQPIYYIIHYDKFDEGLLDQKLYHTFTSCYYTGITNVPVNTNSLFSNWKLSRACNRVGSSIRGTSGVLEPLVVFGQQSYLPWPLREPKPDITKKF